MNSIHQKILTITAPSGAGKTSITQYLIKEFSQLEFSISASTRQPRQNEQNGKDYYFISIEEFTRKIQQKEFAEWEMVYTGKYYGTLKSELRRIWDLDKVPVLDIDIKGALHIQKQYPENILSIFIEPPSVDVLKKRLESRGSETADSLTERINKASYELSFKDHFDRAILNDNFEKACSEAVKLVDDFLKN